jgi:hypothetical protein
MAVPQGFMVCGWESTKSVGQLWTGWKRRHFDSESIVRLNCHCKPMIFVREGPAIECGTALAENNPVDKLNPCTPFSSSITENADRVLFDTVLWISAPTGLNVNSRGCNPRITVDELCGPARAGLVWSMAFRGFTHGYSRFCHFVARK